MTNKEKAKELVSGYGRCCREECRLIALKMAEWKDAQLKEYLEKKYETALNAWDDWAAYDPKTAESWRIKTQYMREIINELFGGE